MIWGQWGGKLVVACLLQQSFERLSHCLQHTTQPGTWAHLSTYEEEGAILSVRSPVLVVSTEQPALGPCSCLIGAQGHQQVRAASWVASSGPGLRAVAARGTGRESSCSTSSRSSPCHEGRGHGVRGEDVCELDKVVVQQQLHQQEQQQGQISVRDGAASASTCYNLVQAALVRCICRVAARVKMGSGAQPGCYMLQPLRLAISWMLPWLCFPIHMDPGWCTV